VPHCISELLDAARGLTPDCGERQRAQQLLEVVAGYEVDAIAGLRWSNVDGAPLTVVWPSSAATDARDARRMFPDSPVELVAELPAPLRGELHLAAPAWVSASADSYRWLVEQSAAVLSLVLRPRPAIDAHTVQLEKLASLGRLAAGVLHDLNNPLTAIMAYADFLSRKLQRDGAERNDLQRLMAIQEAAERIQRLSRELLNYARPDNPHLPLDVHGVIDRALEFCSDGLRDAEIDVQRSYGALPPVRGVEAALTQVFVNLFTNASHALGERGGVLRITTAHDQTLVRVAVADDGPGVAEAHLERIFDAYFSTKPPDVGFGLGLSIVRRVVREHGGQVRAEANDPNGVVFVVELPTNTRS
jgi:signal transduction histidine kinase